MDVFTETVDLRLYRRRPEVVYVGRLHPGFPAEVAEAVARSGQHVNASEVVVRHHAYTSTLTEAKLRWSIRLLEKELHDRPGRLHYLVEYARALLLLDPNDPKGHAVMAEAAAQVAPVVDSPAPPDPDMQRVLEYLINNPPGRSVAAIDAEQATALALRWFPTSPPLLWSAAGRYLQAKQFHSAAALLDQLLKLGNSGGYDRSTAFDPRIIGPWPLMNLGQCYRALGEPDKARRCFELLLTDPEFKDQAATLLAMTSSGASGVGEGKGEG
jgi:tetratricopeptide (TPR) repeat protein